MIAVIFEVWPTKEGEAAYLALAAALREDLERTDGFLSVERFTSLVDPTKLLSFFRDEAAVRAFRNLFTHRAAQTQARDALFRDYRLRVAHVVRDYGHDARDEAPDDSRALHG